VGHWLVYKWRHREPPYQPILRRRSLDAHPSMIVTADGLGPAARHQLWIEEDDLPPPSTDPGALVAKPAYRVPPLAEIAALPWNGLNVVSTFSGCGGSSTGYRWAGYRVLAAVEFVPAAQESYALNMADRTQLLRQDVRDTTGRQILDAAGLDVGELDLFDGSPPCEPFSSAGKRDKTWREEQSYSGQRQRTDDLFFEYARLVDEIRPKVFVAENVEGLVRGRAKGYFLRILAHLRTLGYRVQARVLDAQWLGVPQVRKRLIFVGVREDLGLEPVFPAPLPYSYTTREAIADLLQGGRVHHDTQGQFGRKGDVTDEVPPTVVSAGSQNFKVEEEQAIAYRRDTGGQRQTQADRDRLDEPSPTIAGDGRNAGHYELEVLKTEADGGKRLDPAFQGEGLEIVNARGGHRFKPEQVDLDGPAPTVAAGGNGQRDQTAGVWVEYDEQIVGNEAFEPVFGPLDQPSPTIMAGGARTSGEVQSSKARVRRKLTIPEVKRICGFPDDYQLAGPFSKQWERLGDSVPPPMMRAVAATIAEEILNAPHP
jgi:DNA (cytosine-5)-methyltransferase 1